MKLATSRNIKYLLLTHLAFLVLIALYAFFLLPRPAVEILIPPFLLISSLLIFSSLFLPISAGAIFILIVLAEKNKYAGEEEDGAARLISFLPALVPTLLVYIFLVFFGEPRLIERKKWFEELSNSGVFYFQQAEKNLAAGNVEKALIFIDLYLHIDRNNTRAIDLRNEIRIAWPIVFPDEIIEDRMQAIPGDDRTGQRLLEMAEEFYTRGKYSSAAFYAQMAGGFRNTRVRAGQLLERAAENLLVFAPARIAEQRLFSGKIDLASRIESRDLYGAYYLFHTLSDEFPLDRELAGLGEKLFLLLSENAFFYEDVQRIYFAPGKHDIAFINNADNGKELVFARKIVFTGNNVYLFDINIINLNSSGEIERHIKSQYGKVMRNTLYMLCVGRERRLFLYPEIITGNRNERVSSIDLNIPQEAFMYLGIEGNRFSKMRTSFLIQNLELLSKIGAGKYAPAEALFIRFIRSFNYIFVLLLVITAGISFLKRRTNKTYLALLMLPAVVFAIYFLEKCIIYLKSEILLIFMRQIGMLGAALCLITIIIIELAAAIFYTVYKASSIESYKE
ncbi:MAG: hypothetical protein FWC36_11080 [Spirochaetes bacterium]|nr:hypothetical protein [Spirochaetota bacterium]